MSTSLTTASSVTAATATSATTATTATTASSVSSFVPTVNVVTVTATEVSTTNNGAYTRTMFQNISFTPGQTKSVSIANTSASSSKFMHVTVVNSGSTVFSDVQVNPTRIGVYLGYIEIHLKNNGAATGSAYFAVNVSILE